MIVSETGGLADVDIDGDGTPDGAASLAALGITDAERERLAMLYEPGQSVWRVPVTHFTSWDCNWHYGPPPDAISPDPPDPRGDDPLDDSGNSCCPTPEPTHLPGSIIEAEDQILRESVAVTGTPYTLNYSGDRVPGRQAAYALQIPLRGSTDLPTSLQTIRLEIYVAGQRFVRTFSAPSGAGGSESSDLYSFTWDGRDAYGRTVQGTQVITVRIGYEYGARYFAEGSTGSSFGSIFGRYSSSSALSVAARLGSSNIVIWHVWQGSIGAWDGRSEGLGGWSLDVHHAYDPAGRTLYRGDGGRIRDALTQIVTTVAGNGRGGFSGDGGLAISAQLQSPSGVAVGPDGSLYIADSGNGVVRCVRPDGIITTVAGSRRSDGVLGDGGPATEADLSGAFNGPGIAIGPDGSLYIADYRRARVRRVGPDGIIATVAGNGTEGTAGDGGPASQAQLLKVTDVAVAPDGTLYILQAGSPGVGVRQVGTDGIITRVAGDGLCCVASGEGVSATEARLASPTAIGVGPDGSFYIVQSFGNDHVSRVTQNGIIHSVAGNVSSTAGYSGDGAPATGAQLDKPSGIAVAPDGTLYIADTFNHRLRRVSPNGIITTLAGAGPTGGPGAFGGDDGPAGQARFFHPWGLAVGPDGSLYVADRANDRVRRISPTLPGLSLGEQVVPSADGGELYIFSSAGQHLRTLDSLTGTLRYRFSYDRAGRLMAITDRDGQITSIQRDGEGNPTAIIAPGGQRTALAVNAHGYLSTVANPARNTVALAYTDNGLMMTFTDPRGNVHYFMYDGQGRLARDENPAGGLTVLDRRETDNSHVVTAITALLRSSTYLVERTATEDLHRVITATDGTQTDILVRTDGTYSIHYPDGSVRDVTLGPDPRWGMLAPVIETDMTTTPSGITSTIHNQRTITLADPHDPLSLQTWVATTNINGRTFIQDFVAADHSFTATSPGGHEVQGQVDTHGRLTDLSVDGLAPVNFAYDDALGRLIQVNQGDQSLSYVYDRSNRRLIQESDALGNSVQYVYDNADRVTQATSPNGEVDGFGPDASGNIMAITMANAAVHELGYSAIDQGTSYTPPGGTGSYTARYNAERAPDLLTLPDGRTLDWSYDTGGQLVSAAYAEATVDVVYNSSRQVSRITRTPVSGGSQAMEMTHDGPLLSGIDWTGAAQGNYQYTYDSNFRLTGWTLNSGSDMVTTGLTRNADGQVIGYGPFTTARGGPGGAVTQISDPALRMGMTYDALGRPSLETFTVKQPAGRSGAIHVRFRGAHQSKGGDGRGRHAHLRLCLRCRRPAHASQS
jgi:YD repeat-containing protein